MSASKESGFPRPLRNIDAFYRALNVCAYHVKGNGQVASAAFQNASENGIKTDEFSVDWAELSTPGATAGRFTHWTARAVASMNATDFWEHQQSIKFTPTDSNPAHTSIIGPDTQSLRRKMAKRARVVLEHKDEEPKGDTGAADTAVAPC